MRRLIILIIILLVLPIGANAMEFTAPSVPIEAEKYMPQESKSFGEDLWYVLKTAIADLQPNVAEAVKVSASLLAVTIFISMAQTATTRTQSIIQIGACVSIGLILLSPSNAMINLSIETIEEISQYAKLLLPVMASATAAQGAPTTSTALYTLTAFINSILTSGITKIIIPALYISIVFSIVNGVLENEMVKRFQNSINKFMVWSIKSVLYIFSGFITITGVVSGAADASAVKATKLIISGAVPVVGKIISDASETILVSAGVMKSAVGVYGIIAIFAILIGPFLKIGIQYLILKATTAVCSIFDGGRTTKLIADFSGIMGFLLAVNGTQSLLLLISTVCFMKGIA